MIYYENELKKMKKMKKKKYKYTKSSVDSIISWWKVDIYYICISSYIFQEEEKNECISSI